MPRSRQTADSRRRSCSVQLQASMPDAIDCISRKWRFPMTLRRNTSIAAFAFLALACAMLSSSTPWAAEPAPTVAAGPGESPSPGDADTTPGDTSDSAPAAAPGEDQASPEGSEPGKDAGAPGAEETSEPKEEEPANGEEQAAPAKPDEAEGKGE